VIHYISYFLDPNEISGRKLEVAGQSKIKYLIDCIKRSGFAINVVSTARSADNGGFSSSKSFVVGCKEKHLYLASLGSRSIFEKRLGLIFLQFQLILYFARQVKKDDIAIFYHSLSYIPALSIVRKILKPKLIIEFNDLYAAQCADKNRIAKLLKIERSVLDNVDAHIFASPYMTELVVNKKPYVINYGSYEVRKKREKIGSDKVNVVYAGVIENMRQSATLVAKAALCLPEGYKIHVAGYGYEKNVGDFLRLVCLINDEKGYEAIKYHGLLLGEDLADLLDGCDISVSAHAYSNDDIWKAKYSFPSKIPLTMGHGLYLVAHSMDVIANSPFSECTEFYNEFSSHAIAEAILRCNIRISTSSNGLSPRSIISELDKKFIEEFKSMLNAMIC